MIVREAHLLCHPEVVEMVAEVCGAEPGEEWPGWGLLLGLTWGCRTS